MATLEMLGWYVNVSHGGAAVDLNEVLSVLDGQTSFP